MPSNITLFKLFFFFVFFLVKLKLHAWLLVVMSQYIDQSISIMERASLENSFRDLVLRTRLGKLNRRTHVRELVLISCLGKLIFRTQFENIFGNTYRENPFRKMVWRIHHLKTHSENSDNFKFKLNNNV